MDNFLSNGVQGCTSPFAVGVGLDRPTVIYIGDGTLGEGVVYEALNLSKLTKSKILFVVEDNGISQSTPSQIVLSGSISRRFESFDISCLSVDTAKPIEMVSKLGGLLDKWKDSACMALIAKSYRLNSHSKGDDTRSTKYIQDMPDPLKILCESLHLEYNNEFERAIEIVRNAWNKVTSEVVMSSMPIQRLDEPVRRYNSIDFYATGRVNEYIRSALSVQLENSAFFIGEDIVTRWHRDDESYGGAFGVSLGLSEKYENVVGTSISEAGLVGLAAGRAMSTGKLSIAEIMFADFSTLIVDQVFNGIDKYRKMYGVDIKIPLVIRVPYGMGSGYGPTHSQSPFELFSSLTETLVISYNPLLDYSKILTVIADKMESVLLFEPKSFYGDRIESWFNLLDGFDVQLISGRVSPSILIRSSSKPRVRIVTHGSAVKCVLEAMRSSDIPCEILIVTELYQDVKYLNLFSSTNTPVVIVDEKNSRYGALEMTLSKELMQSNKDFNVVTNAAVVNIPANKVWEEELMINKSLINMLVSEALL